jgi:hypothetical protein
VILVISDPPVMFWGGMSSLRGDISLRRAESN